MKVKTYFLNQLNQFIPVVLGVYIGIVASNWNANRVKNAEQIEFVKNLELEIQSNKFKLEETLAYQQTILSSARKVRQELDPKTMKAGFWSVGHFKLLPAWEGLRIPTLENSVHQSGIMTNALSGLEFLVINSIARSYARQEEYKMYSQRLILDNLPSPGSDITTAEVLTNLEVWHDIITAGQELLKQYALTLSELKKIKRD